MIGSTIGKYHIVEQLGRGGMGTVYKAIDETLDREVAIKALNADFLTEESVQRFRGEAVLLAKLNHPRIAAIHELTRQDKNLLMVMEYVKGETCEKLVARTGPLTIARAAVLCDQILDALEHAHTAGVVHRDLKPGNVMVTPTGDVKVMDFGIARVAGSQHLTLDGYMMGTPAYMAPEQVRGEEVDRRMDLYSTAVMLYRLLTSRLPFEADSTVSLIHAQLSDPPTPPRQFRPDLPEWMDDILTRGLAKAPADRFQTAAEFRAALERGLAGTLSPLQRPASAPDDVQTLRATPTPTALRKVANVAAAAQPEPSPASASLASMSPATPAAASSMSTGAARAEPTVTLRKPQLALAGGLLALLVVGVGILAYAALRRPITVIAPVPPPVTTAPQPQATVAATANPPAGVTSSAAATSPSTTPAPAPAAAAAIAKPVEARASSPAAATAAAPRSARPSTKPGGTAKVTRADLAASAAAAPEATAPAPAPAPPAASAATLPAQSFGDIRTLVADGTNAAKSKELDALLSLEPDKLILRSRDDGGVVKTAAYRSFVAATYAHTKGPRWQEGEKLAKIPKSFGGSGFFLKSSKHWLTLQSRTEFVILRLEDKNVTQVIASIESRTGLKVQRTADKD